MNKPSPVLRLHYRRLRLDRARGRPRALRRCELELDNAGARTAIWDPVTDTWTEAGTKFGTVANTKKGNANEKEPGACCPSGNVLTSADHGDGSDAERRRCTPSRGRLDRRRENDLDTAPVGSIGGTTLNEIGGAVTLMNGKAFFVGGSDHAGVYTSGATPGTPQARGRSKARIFPPTRGTPTFSR